MKRVSFGLNCSMMLVICPRSSLWVFVASHLGQGNNSWERGAQRRGGKCSAVPSITCKSADDELLL